MLKQILIAFSLLLHLSSFGQLADGSTAPDFTLTDYYGTEHHLNAYLEAGKTVFVEIFAAHCPGCWSYHQTHTLKNLYNTYGPEGTDEVMVLALEHDQWNNHNAFIGDGPTWVTQGNWLEGTPFPIFDVEDPDRGVFDDYNVTGYPIVYKICPNGITERVSTSLGVEQLYEKVQECQATLSILESKKLGNVYFDSARRTLNIDSYEKVRSVRVVSIAGHLLQSINDIGSSAVFINPMVSGIYLFEIHTENETIVRKFYLD